MIATATAPGLRNFQALHGALIGLFGYSLGPGLGPDTRSSGTGSAEQVRGTRSLALQALYTSERLMTPCQTDAGSQYQRHPTSSSDARERDIYAMGCRSTKHGSENTWMQVFAYESGQTYGSTAFQRGRMSHTAQRGNTKGHHRLWRDAPGISREGQRFTRGYSGAW